MITQRVSATQEAVFNANSSLATGEDECVLYREDVEALLDHVENLEYEVSKLKGDTRLKYPVATLYEALNRRAD